MAWTQDDIDKLDAAIAAGRGAQTIAFLDHQVTFRSVEEMKELRRMMTKQVNSSTSPSFRYGTTSKGV